MAERFSGGIELDGINPYVDVPSDIVERLGGTPPIAVTLLLRPESTPNDARAPALPADASRLRAIGRLSDDGWFRSTVLTRRAGEARLYLDQWMREAAGVSVGDRVTIELRPDGLPRDLKLPTSLQDGLNADPMARAAWEDLPPSRRREILSYLNFLKTPAALERNVEKTLRSLAKKGSAS